MPYIGNPIYQSAFVTDQFNGDGSTVAFTMSVAPAGTTNVLVVVSGVVQDPSTYGVTGTTLTFTAAPPTGTGNISVRYLGIPVTGVVTTAYRTVTEFTATASQTTFTPPSYTVGFINVYLNGVLLGSADYTATNGTTVVLATGASAGNLVTIESFRVETVLNAISNSVGSVTSSNLSTSAVTATKMASASVDLASSTVTGILPSANGGTGTSAGVTGFKNRIINGAMVIDQRNAGASVTPTTGVYTLDRWFAAAYSASSKFSVQQNAGSVTPPVGFTNYLGVTSLSAYSVSASDFLCLIHSIEGYNIADLGWGTANAKTVTLSFWVRSSLTGTFGGALANQDGSRSYPFSYTISTSNTWEQKSITIAGETSGTWLTTNGLGLTIRFGLGVGSTYLGTAGAWATSGNYFSATGATSVVGTNGATFYITGVQLEVGSTATSFDYRPYGTELALCQRYFEIIGVESQSMFADTYSNTGNVAIYSGAYNVNKRAAPTMTQFGTFTASNTDGVFNVRTSKQGFSVWYGTGGTGRSYWYNENLAGLNVSAEL